MDYRNSEDGYTFASLLLSLTIVMLTIPIIILLLTIFQYEEDESYIDVHQFFEHLHQKSLVAKNIEINQKQNELQYTIESRYNDNYYATTTIEQYGNNIRKIVSGQGHEIYLQHIASFEVKPVSYGFRVYVVMENGEEYEKTIEQNATRE